MAESKAPLFIVGYMASGKTTFGKALAKRLGREFIDLDFYITQRFRKTIADIFSESGESGFRRIEAEMLREAGEFENTVISCGGGTPCFLENMDYMLSRGNVVRLEADEECLLRRLCANPHKRPLVAGKNPDEIRKVIREGLAVREPYYSRANITFGGSSLENAKEISGSVDEFLREYPDI